MPDVVSSLTTDTETTWVNETCVTTRNGRAEALPFRITTTFQASERRPAKRRSADLQRLPCAEVVRLANAHFALVLAGNLDASVVRGHRAGELLERRLWSAIGSLLGRLHVARAMLGVPRAQSR